MGKGNFKLGAWAFIIGLFLAVILGFLVGASTPDWAIFVLVVLGLIVGILNVKGKVVQKFLIAAIAFMFSFQSLSYMFSVMTNNWPAVGNFFGLLNVFIAPAAAIVAIKALYTIAKD